jgi:hypothetical protein
VIIGRILTDEEFRERFLANPVDTLSPLSELGDDLTRGETERSRQSIDGCGRSDRTGSMRNCHAALLARARQSPVGADREHEG